MSSTTTELGRHVLIDTNVWINAVDPREQSKSLQANAVITSLTRAARVAVTPQVVAEFFDATTRRQGGFAPILTSMTAAEHAVGILAGALCLDLTAASIHEAIRAAVAFQMRVFDAHIWAAARVNGIRLILTEDNQSQPIIEGVRYVDPFSASFNPAQIGL
jgi:predicted nucleic acid-binding protein